MRKIIFGFLFAFLVLGGITFLFFQEEGKSDQAATKAPSVTTTSKTPATFLEEYEGYKISPEGFFGQLNENSNTRKLQGDYSAAEEFFNKITASWTKTNGLERKATITLGNFSGKLLEIPVVIVEKATKGTSEIALARVENNNLEAVVQIKLNPKDNEKLLFAKEQLLFFYKTEKEEKEFWSTLNN